MVNPRTDKWLHKHKQDMKISAPSSPARHRDCTVAIALEIKNERFVVQEAEWLGWMHNIVFQGLEKKEHLGSEILMLVILLWICKTAHDRALKRHWN